MATMDMRREGDVYVITLDNGGAANTFDDSVLEEYHRLMDELEAAGHNAAAVVTSADPKAWTTGINLEWLQTKGPGFFPEWSVRMDRFFRRWALLPMPTVACITGHAFAGGAIFACAFDFRLMRADRGFFCFSEVDVRIPFSPLMHEVLDLLPGRQALWELALTGRRMGGEEAARRQVVDQAHGGGELFAKSMELAATLAAKDRATYAAIKRGLKRRLADLP